MSTNNVYCETYYFLLWMFYVYDVLMVLHIETYSYLPIRKDNNIGRRFVERT